MLGSVLLIIAVIINLSYWLCLYSRLIWYRESTAEAHPADQPLDIIVVYKNAKEQISRLIPQLLQQRHSHYQVVAVDDHSTDGVKWDHSSAAESPHFIPQKATVDSPGKKAALQEAIDNSRADIVLLTDADCRPASQHWAKLMAVKAHGQHQMVLGYSPVTPGPGWLNAFSRYETWLTAVQYLSYALAGMPYMGVGRNICYQRSLVAGYQHDMTIQSGDDDLLVSALAHPDNATICIDPDSFVYTDAQLSLRAYSSQKARHMTTAPKYRWHHQILLSAFAGSQMLIYPLAAAAAIWGNMSLMTTLLILIIYAGIKMTISNFLLKKLKEEALIIWAPLLDILLTAYYIMMSIRILVPKKGW